MSVLLIDAVTRPGGPHCRRPVRERAQRCCAGSTRLFVASLFHDRGRSGAPRSRELRQPWRSWPHRSLIIMRPTIGRAPVNSGHLDSPPEGPAEMSETEGIPTLPHPRWGRSPATPARSAVNSPLAIRQLDNPDPICIRHLIDYADATLRTGGRRGIFDSGAGIAELIRHGAIDLPFSSARTVAKRQADRWERKRANSTVKPLSQENRRRSWWIPLCGRACRPGEYPFRHYARRGYAAPARNRAAND